MALNTDQRFFYEHAGYSYDPKTQTPEQGRVQCAERMATAEAKGRDSGLSFEWKPDEEIDSSAFSKARPTWQLWVCIAHSADGSVVASLCGIDFGRDGEPWGNAYRRVVETELASEAIA